jgi:ligand-binding sensor domain-containing protein
MKRYFLQIQVFNFLTIIILGTSCNGQVKKDLSKEKISESNTISQGQPKLIKNLGLSNDKGNNVHCSLQDKAGNLWFGTTGDGLFKYDGKSFTQYTTSNGLNHNSVNHILEDKDGKIWIGTDAGLVLYDPARRSDSASLRAGGKTLTEYTAKDGLGGTEFWGIYIEESGIIWVTARGSTTRFDPSIPLPNPKAFKVFTPADGLNCCVQSMFQDKSGNMWWGTGQGLYRFDGARFYQVKKNGPC